MYIRRKVFSVLNLDGEQRLFSTNSIDFCENGEVRLFSDEEELSPEELERQRIREEVEQEISDKLAIGRAGVLGFGSGALGADYVYKKGGKAVRDVRLSGHLLKERARLSKAGQYVTDKAGKVGKYVSGSKVGKFVSENASKAGQYVSNSKPTRIVATKAGNAANYVMNSPVAKSVVKRVPAAKGTAKTLSVAVPLAWGSAKMTQGAIKAGRHLGAKVGDKLAAKLSEE